MALARTEGEAERSGPSEYLKLLQAQQGYLERVALAILGNWADAEDALQETALAGYRHYGQLQGGAAAFPFWIRRILIRQCGDILARRRKLVPMHPLEPAPGLGATPGPEAGADGTGGEVWERVLRLNDTLRPVVVMRYLLEMPQAEIAGVLGIPVGTVKSRLGKALALLRQELERGGEQRWEMR